MARLILLCATFFVLFLSIFLFTSQADYEDITKIFILSIAIAGSAFVALKRKPNVLYIWLPVILLVGAVATRGNVVPEGEVLIPNMAMWWATAYIFFWNAVRPKG